ncbi:PAS domain-containing sensor histidine kinase [Kaistia defluvii]|uniref:histidine kinase n=1 Tax=Kaistia defluvii TaxID=410841 RepID=A0ABV2R5U0_9HYPH
MAAASLACVIFAIDLRHGVDSSVAVLYALVVVLGSMGTVQRVTWSWAGICAVLAGASYAWAYKDAPDFTSTYKLAFALVAIAITASLVTSRKRLVLAQVKLEDSRREQRILADSVPQILWGTDASGQCNFLNARYAEYTGISVDDAVRANSWVEPVHPEDRPGMLRLWLAARASGNEFRAHCRVRHRDGTYRWMHSIGRPVRSPETGEIVRWMGGLSDVDDEFKAQKRIQKLNRELEDLVAQRTVELQETRWRFRSLYEDPNIFVAEQNWSESGAILDDLRAKGVTNLRSYLLGNPEVLQACLAGVRTVDVNDAIWRKLGYESKADLVTKAPRDGVVDAVAALLPQLEALFEGRDYVTSTTALVRADGGRMPVIFAVNLMPDGTAYATLFDITDREAASELMAAAQQELARANRVATVGALSISIAHELNQPIASISVDIETGLRMLAKDEPDYDMVARILARLRRNAGRLASIVQQTRDQITNHQRRLELVDLTALTEETRLLLEREVVARRAVVKIRAASSVPRVLVDRIALQQVLVNLIVNALDALAAVPEQKRNVEVSVEPGEEGHVRVRVADTGPGIHDDVLAKIFTPFFTTKPDGIGMGLQICRTTVERLGGELHVTNLPEGGASFEFTLPAAASEMAEAC